MLDNRSVEVLRRLVEVARSIAPHVLLEASGGVTLESVRTIAQTGVDLISSSALTMGAPPVNVGLTLLG
jgi:nicotinate-nucleotide pyrophosphorylase (carboxylating)